MATITEDYVSFETAKLLKEKGFDGFCERFYDYYPETGEVHICGCDEHNNSRYDDEFSMPTIQMVMKWLREVHNIFICVLFFEESNGFGYTIENVIKKKYITTSKNLSYKEPEEAGEAAIKYCLKNLI